MGRLGWLRVLVLIPFVAWSAPARADDWGRGEDPDAFAEAKPRRPPRRQRSFTDHPGHLMASVGFGTLVGFLGVDFGYSVLDWLGVGAGYGVNALGSMGGPYVRLRPEVDTSRSGTLQAFAFDAGLSIGGFSFQQGAFRASLAHAPAEDYPHYHSDLALFLQTEMSWETVNVEGFSTRLGGGLTTLLNPGNVECEPSTSETAYAGKCSQPPMVFPVLLFQLGMVF